MLEFENPVCPTRQGHPGQGGSRTHGGGNHLLARYVWNPVYVDALLFRDRDRDGDPETGWLGAESGLSGLDERYYALYDANYNVVALTGFYYQGEDALGWGTLAERYYYDPYGQVTVLAPDGNGGWVAAAGNQSAVEWEVLHQGGRLDGLTGRYYFRARDLDPELGRWTTADRLRYPDGMNYYQGYAGNPIIRRDPSGTQATAPASAPAPRRTLPVSVDGKEIGTLSFIFGTTNKLTVSGEPESPGALLVGGFRANDEYKKKADRCKTFFWIQTVTTNAVDLAVKPRAVEKNGKASFIDNGGDRDPWYTGGAKRQDMFDYTSLGQQWDFGFDDRPERRRSILQQVNPIEWTAELSLVSADVEAKTIKILLTVTWGWKATLKDDTLAVEPFPRWGLGSADLTLQLLQQQFGQWNVKGAGN